ncbi:hypothetical protein [uncultured Endozoicomonas sp.]|uniref:hypothetical protein n=1 Tax=uncultured Endozoicomonas sp. TaxID=432652 RepID=UPI0026344F60|nr:hypothetical protein [uncultured Endozoicomonas sp.]
MDFCDTESVENPNFTDEQLQKVRDLVTESMNDGVTDTEDLSIIFNDFLSAIDSTSKHNGEDVFPDSHKMMNNFEHALRLLLRGESYEEAALRLI